MTSFCKDFAADPFAQLYNMKIAYKAHLIKSVPEYDDLFIPGDPNPDLATPKGLYLHQEFTTVTTFNAEVAARPVANRVRPEIHAPAGTIAIAKAQIENRVRIQERVYKAVPLLVKDFLDTLPTFDQVHVVAHPCVALSELESVFEYLVGYNYN